jgi:GDP-4-dehydro-6-deoxy-D-mannose reductase
MHLAIDRCVFQDESAALRRRVIGDPLEEIFSALADRPESRLVYTSSAWVLPSGDRLDEETPPQPFTIYGRNKLHGEQLLPALHAHTHVDWINLRLFNIFGRYEAPHRLLPYVVDRLTHGQIATVGNPEAVRDFTDVDVIAGAYAAAVAAPANASGATYHIGSGHPITIREFALAAADVVGRPDLVRFAPLQLPDGGVSSQVANPELARRILGWSAVRDVEADIRSAARALLEAANCGRAGV